MAATVTSVTGRAESIGSKRFVIVDIALDASYPTGGESITAGTFGLATVDFVLCEPSAGYTFEYDHANSKLLAYYSDNNNASDGPAIQVPNTTDLSALTSIRAFVIGTA